jgi:hypothetical protein
MISSTIVCIECNTRVQGRADKKFCSDACRNAYHNKNRTEIMMGDTQIKLVNQILRRNRSILLEILQCKNPNRPVSIFVLKVKGFEFSFCTHLVNDNKGNAIHCCYDIGYQYLDNGRVRIIRDF